MADFDLAIIGGGINGAAIARDAAGRGLKVLLAEQNDLGSGTSSASSKLIHGGLRYLEQGALGLVRASLREREILLRTAPHLVRPLRFVVPVDEARRSPFVIRLGLLLYDWMSPREILPGTRAVDLIRDEAGQPLRRRFHYGFEYSDCFADDSRLVVLNAVDAAERGAVIRTRTRCLRGERAQQWRLVLNAHGQREEVGARVLVNATGAWADDVAEMVLRQDSPRRLRLDKGSHVVVRRIYDGDRAYVLQAADRRVVFTIPFERDFTLIGTTDRSFSGEPAAVVPTVEEIDYLCGVVNDYFRTSITGADAVWAYAGVRALYNDGARKPQDVGRDATLVLDTRAGQAPLLTVYGGKLTTHRRLAEDVLARLARFFPRRTPWTAHSPLPGGEFAYDSVAAQIGRALERWPFLAADHARRLVGAYGTRVESVLGTAASMDDLGMRFGADLTAAEVRHLMKSEWARTADDVLWRRSKLGLRFSDAQRATLDLFMAPSKGSSGSRSDQGKANPGPDL